MLSGGFFVKKTLFVFLGGVSIFIAGCNLNKVEDYKEQPQPMSPMEVYNRTGGQPGYIRLNGDFLDSNNNLKTSVSVNQNAGNNVDGGTPEISKDRLKISKIGTEMFNKPFSSSGRVLVFGCPASVAGLYNPKISDAEKKQDTIIHDEEALKFDDYEMSIDVSADTILICSPSMLSFKVDSSQPISVFLFAKKVILYGANLKFDPIQTQFFGIETAELILIGDSHISNNSLAVNYRGPDFFTANSSYNLFSIGITTNKITCDGHLEIQTIGLSKK